MAAKKKTKVEAKFKCRICGAPTNTEYLIEEIRSKNPDVQDRYAPLCDRHAQMSTRPYATR